jgi:hypothetical protein
MDFRFEGGPRPVLEVVLASEVVEGDYLAPTDKSTIFVYVQRIHYGPAIIFYAEDGRAYGQRDPLSTMIRFKKFK